MYIISYHIKIHDIYILYSITGNTSAAYAAAAISLTGLSTVITGLSSLGCSGLHTQRIVPNRTAHQDRCRCCHRRVPGRSQLQRPAESPGRDKHREKMDRNAILGVSVFAHVFHSVLQNPVDPILGGLEKF